MCFANKMESEGRAIPLIIFQEKEGFKPNPEGMDILSSITGKVAVVAVAGKYRTGKSYLLNRVVLNLPGNGFQVGPTINPCTKGLWIWNQPIQFTTSDGDQVNLIVVDTEGIGAFDEDQNHDTRIFMLAVLLSSYFIYNSIGSIDENALNNLNLVVNLTKNLQVRASDASLDVDEVADYFPSFLWVIRDFSLKLEDASGNPITSREYLENALTPQKGVSDSIEAKNRIRKLLKHFFKDRDCFVVVRPTEDERVLQNLNTAQPYELRGEFVRQIDQLKTLINRKVKPKLFNGQAMTGEMLRSMVYAYTEAINKGGVPTIEGAWTSICGAERQKNIEQTTKNYEVELKQAIPAGPINPKKLKNMHKELRSKAVAALKSNAVGEYTQEYEDAMLAKLDERFNIVAQQNERKINQECKQMASALEQEMQDRLKQGEFTDFNEFKREFEAKSKALKEQGSDAAMTEMKLKELAATLLSDAAEYISRGALMEHKNENRRLLQQMDFLTLTLNNKKEDYQSEKTNLMNRIQMLETENYELKGTKASLEVRLEELKAEKLRLEEKLENSYGARVDSSEYREKYEELLETHNKEIKALNAQINQAQKEAVLGEQERQYKEKEISSLKDSLRQTETNYKEVKSQLKAANQALEEKQRAISGLQQSASAPAEWQMEKTYLQSHIDTLQSQLESSRAVQEKLITALQTKPEKEADTKDSKTIAYERLEGMYEKQQEKLEGLQEFKDMIDHASALQCKACGKTISCKVFRAHIASCFSEMSRINNEGGYYTIVVPQSIIKDAPDMKPYTEYVMNITYKQKTWSATRRFKLFANLHNSLMRNFPDVQLPDGDLFISQSPSRQPGKAVELDERRRAVQNYLMELASIPVVKNSDIFRKFLCVEQQFGEEPVQKRVENPRSFLDFA